jgi:septum formation topological specificity factor MinE
MAKKSQQDGVTNEKIMGFLVEMDARMTNMDERITDISNRMATKDNLEQMKEEIIEPILKAVDKDAETIFDHGKRIVSLEKQVAIIAQ